MAKCGIEVFWLRRIRGARRMHSHVERETKPHKGMDVKISMYMHQSFSLIPMGKIGINNVATEASPKPNGIA